MNEEIKSLKASVTSYKSANTKLRKENEELKRLLKDAEVKTDELRYKIVAQNDAILSLSDEVTTTKKDLDAMLEELERQSKPWWKRLF